MECIRISSKTCCCSTLPDVYKRQGYAHMGVGRASGKDKAEAAANMAISSPLLETAINGAKGVIINITSSPDIGLDEIETASSMIAEQARCV